MDLRQLLDAICTRHNPWLRQFGMVLSIDKHHDGRPVRGGVRTIVLVLDYPLENTYMFCEFSDHMKLLDIARTMDRYVEGMVSGVVRKTLERRAVPVPESPWSNPLRSGEDLKSNGI